MIETDDQRRWWFATHPEFSWSKRGSGSRGHRKEEKKAQKFWPEDVDAYVDEQLKYATGTEAILLEAIKHHIGTEASSGSGTVLAGPLREPGRPYFDMGYTGGGGRGAPPPPSSTPPVGGGGVPRGPAGRPSGAPPKPPGRTGLSNPSRKLGREMIKARRPRPSKFHDAHHIVPEKDSRWPEPQEARDILDKWGIDLYHPDNGAWLPRVPGISNSTHHNAALHNPEAYREVVMRLRGATSQEAVLNTLREIGQELETGSFLKKK